MHEKGQLQLFDLRDLCPNVSSFSITVFDNDISEKCCS